MKFDRPCFKYLFRNLADDEAVAAFARGFFAACDRDGISREEAILLYQAQCSTWNIGKPVPVDIYYCGGKILSPEAFYEKLMGGNPRLFNCVTYWNEKMPGIEAPCSACRHSNGYRNRCCREESMLLCALCNNPPHELIEIVNERMFNSVIDLADEIIHERPVIIPAMRMLFLILNRHLTGEKMEHDETVEDKVYAENNFSDRLTLLSKEFKVACVSIGEDSKRLFESNRNAVEVAWRKLADSIERTEIPNNSQINESLKRIHAAYLDGEPMRCLPIDSAKDLEQNVKKNAGKITVVPDSIPAKWAAFAAALRFLSPYQNVPSLLDFAAKPTLFCSDVYEFIRIRSVREISIEFLLDPAPSFLFWIEDEKRFYYCPAEPEQDFLAKLLYTKSIKKVCWQPYLLYAVCRKLGYELHQIHAIDSCEQCLAPHRKTGKMDVVLSKYLTKRDGFGKIEASLPNRMRCFVTVAGRQAAMLKADMVKMFEQKSREDEVLGWFFMRDKLSPESPLLFHFGRKGIIFSKCMNFEAPTEPGYFVQYMVLPEKLGTYTPQKLYLKLLAGLAERHYLQRLSMQVVHIFGNELLLFVGVDDYEFLTTYLQDGLNLFAVHENLSSFSLHTSRHKTGDILPTGGSVETAVE